MAGTPNPSLNVNFLNGQTAPVVDLAEDSVVFLGHATGGAKNNPHLVATLAGSLADRHGPLVAATSHHQRYSQTCYAQRIAASTPGLFGSVTSTHAGGSTGVLTPSATSYTLHPTVNGTVALNVTTGWVLPGAPLPLTVTSGASTVAHTQTVTYVDEAGAQQVEVLAIPGAGSVTTEGDVAQVLSVTSNIAPVGLQSYTAVHAGPEDRYDFLVEFLTGAQLTGQPEYRLSFDDGVTFSATRRLPASGAVDVTSYAPGLVPQATGTRLTFSNSATPVGTVFGAVAEPNSSTEVGIVFQGLTKAATVTIVVAGNNTLLSVVTVGDDVTINVATDGTGTSTSTGDDIADFIATSPSAGAVAARSVLSARSTGAGSIEDGAGAFTFLGWIDYVAAVDGVRIRHVAVGNDTPGVTVTRVGRDVTVSLATGPEGAQTSTAMDVINAVLAAVPDLVASATTGSGSATAGVFGYVSIPTTFARGDRYRFSTTPPSPTTSDISDALTTLLEREDVLSAVSGVVLLKDGADANDEQALLDFVAAARARYQYKWVAMQAPYMGTTPEATWVTNTVAAYPNRNRVVIGAGEFDMVIPAYGTQQRRNVTHAFVARTANVPISEFASHVECETLRGTQFGLPGVGAHPVAGSTPPQYVSLWQSEDALQQLHAQNFMTLRTWPGLSGIFVRQDVQHTGDDDDYIFVPRERVANSAARLAFLEGIRFVNAALLVDRRTGLLAEVEAQKIENNVYGRIAAKMFGEARRHLSDLAVIVDRTVNYQQTRTVDLTVAMVAREPAITFNVGVGFVLNF